MTSRRIACVAVVFVVVAQLGGCYRSHERPEMRSDVSGNGRDDILVFTRDADAGVYVATSNGARFGASSRWTRFDPPGPFPALGALFGGVPEVGDFDGDGTFDIVAFGDDAWVALSDGARFGASTSWAEHTGFAGSSAERTGVGDFNGDGRHDVFKYSADADVEVGLSDGARFSAWRAWGRVLHDGRPAPGGDDTPPRVGDFNGDGRDDLATFAHGDDADVFVSLSNGSGFAPSVKWHDMFNPGDGWIEDTGSGGSRRFYQTSGVGDFDGDGRDDIVGFTRHTDADVFVALSDGSSFGPASKWHDVFAVGTELPGVGDFDGDGRDDIVTFICDSPGGDVFVALSTGSRFNGTGVLWHDSFCGNGWPMPSLVNLAIAN